ncbi:hypothetical protein BJ508DRAFT_304780 [Ascobolus immersus RN42]|uniref:RRM domain-containing protein n=1 Tax=Ascobolus immersus RN42 TaxID=1160509 RepID=A0A3N4INZ7_ASCIM|nr:hypothetical protein BJ508DRAFT_304780 [Ascobolus immersus RN42]
MAGDNDTLGELPSSRSGSTVIHIRGLPPRTTLKEVKTMLMMASDVLDVSLIPPSPIDENGGSLGVFNTFAIAKVKFKTLEAAEQVKERLQGKRLEGGEPFAIDFIDFGMSSGRRNTTSNGATPPASDLTAMTPPATSMFPLSPQSGMDYMAGRPQQAPLPTGKSMIRDVEGEEIEYNTMIQEIEFQNPQSQQPRQNLPPNSTAAIMPNLPKRRATNPTFGMSIALNTNVPGVNSPMSANINSPIATPIVGGLNGMGPNSAMGQALPPSHFTQYPRVLPAANPADQNPPCNTLYVGNLPMNTSEDELKALFSRQRGYKRLSFRTKNNGPMCFVEFEDIAFATRALNELYGRGLSNSVKGGIRLSFSKNPLGVRTQSSGLPGSSNGLSSPLTPQTANPFSPTLHAPPGLPLPGTQANGPSPQLSMPQQPQPSQQLSMQTPIQTRPPSSFDQLPGAGPVGSGLNSGTATPQHSYPPVSHAEMMSNLHKQQSMMPSSYLQLVGK